MISQRTLYRALDKYGEEVCREAYAMHMEGNGANTIAHSFRIFGGKTRCADAAINAGRALVETDRNPDAPAHMPRPGETFQTSTGGPRTWRVVSFSAGRTRTAVTARVGSDAGTSHTFELVPGSRDARGICTYTCDALACVVYI